MATCCAASGKVPVECVPAPCFEVSKEFSTATVLHDKVHALLVLETGQQLDDKWEPHQSQYIPFSPQMLCLLHTLHPFRLTDAVEVASRQLSDLTVNISIGRQGS